MNQNILFKSRQFSIVGVLVMYNAALLQVSQNHPQIIIVLVFLGFNMLKEFVQMVQLVSTYPQIE